MGRFFGKIFGEGKVPEKNNEPEATKVGEASKFQEEEENSDLQTLAKISEEEERIEKEKIDEAVETLGDYLSRDHVNLMVTNAPSNTSELELQDRKIYDNLLTRLVAELKLEGEFEPFLIENFKNNTAKDLEEHLAKKYNRVKPTSGMRPILTDYNSKD